MRDLPAGTVSFLFTDVEGSTKLLHDLGAEEYSRVLAAHRRVLREALAANQGVEVDTQGDAFFVAFPTAPGALGAAAKALEGLSPGPIRVRMGIHTGRRTWARSATSESTCTGRRGSPRPDTAGRFEAQLFTAVEERLRTALGAGYAAAKRRASLAR